MGEVTDRAAREQHTSHERALIERLLPNELAQLSGSALAELRGEVQNDRARRVIEAGNDRDGYRAIVDHSALQVRFGDAALAWWRVSAREAAVPEVHQVEVGEPMRARTTRGSIYGAYDGCNWLGEPYLRACFSTKVEVLRLQWRDVSVLRPERWRREPPTASELRTAVIGVSAPLAVAESVARAFDVSLDAQAIGRYSVRHFVRALRGAGYFVCMRGSAVRDALNGDAVKDVDLVTTAPEAAAWSVITGAAPEYDLSAFRLSLRSQQNGTAQVPARLTSEHDRGLQLASTRRWGIAAMSEQPHDALTRFGTSLEEDAWAHDFRINTLYAFLDDEERWWLADPTGTALADVTAKRLTPQRWPDNVTNPARFWKFRARGFSSDGRTKELMVAQLQRLTASYDRFVWSWALIAASYLPRSEGDPARAIAAFLSALAPVMREDGAAEIFERWLATDAFRQALVSSSAFKGAQ